MRNCEYYTDTEEPLKAGKVREEEHEAHPRVVPEGPEETEDPCVRGPRGSSKGRTCVLLAQS